MPVIGFVDVRDAYAYESVSDKEVGGCYMTFDNLKRDDRWLVDVRPTANSPFQSAVVMAFGVDNNGSWVTARLAPPSGQLVQITPGTPTVLSPGHVFIMLTQLTKRLTAGLTFDIKLAFDDGSSGVVPVHTRPYP